MKTLYDILEVSQNASPTVIQGAYRALLKNAANHPDLGGSSEAAQAINEAYSILSNPDTRREYDQTLAQPAPADPGPRIIVACPHCRRRNLLRDESDVAREKCRHCNKRLASRPGALRPDVRENDDARAYRVGIFLFDRRLYDRARWEFQSAVRLKPRNPKYHYWLGRTYYQKRSLASARAAFKTAALLQPGQFHYQFWLGQTEYARGAFPPAAEGFGAARKLRPSHMPTLLKLGICWFRMGRFDDAAAVLGKAVRQGSGRMQSFIWLGLSELARNDRAAALAAFQQAERLGPGNTFVQRYLRICRGEEEGPAA